MANYSECSPTPVQEVKWIIAEASLCDGLNQAASADTGKKLYPTLAEERFSL